MDLLGNAIVRTLFKPTQYASISKIEIDLLVLLLTNIRMPVVVSGSGRLMVKTGCSDPSGSSPNVRSSESPRRRSSTHTASGR